MPINIRMIVYMKEIRD